MEFCLALATALAAIPMPLDAMSWGMGSNDSWNVHG